MKTLTRLKGPVLGALLGALAALPIASMASSSAPAAFPEPGKMVKVIVPFVAGGGVDSAARLFAEQLRKQLGTTVIVENRVGGSGVVGGRAVLAAAPDGYTLLFSAATHVLAKQVLAHPPYEPPTDFVPVARVGGSGVVVGLAVLAAAPDGYTLLFSAATHVLAKQVLAHPPYDPQTDFVPVARVGEAPLMLVISPQLPHSKLGEVLAAGAKSTWTAAIPAVGAPSHLATLLLAQQGRMRLEYVPYKGTQPALVDVGGGHVDLLLDSMVSVLPLAKAGKVRPIAITSGKRSPLAPEVPTMQESGLPRFAYTSWYGLWAPKDTPADRVQRLNQASNAAVAELARAGAFASPGIDTVSARSDEHPS